MLGTRSLGEILSDRVMIAKYVASAGIPAIASLKPSLTKSRTWFKCRGNQQFGFNAPIYTVKRSIIDILKRNIYIYIYTFFF